MKSTDHNINNPLKSIEIDLLNSVENLSVPSMIPITQVDYDNIKMHDPTTYYVITDYNGKRVYLGDMLIEDDSKVNRVIYRYYLGLNDADQYIIYVNELAGTCDNIEKLVPVCAYDNPRSAMDALARFNKVGSHHDEDLNIYNTILSYIDKNISTHEFIIGLMVIFNYNSNSKLQLLNEYAMSYHVDKNMQEFSVSYLEIIARMKKTYPDSLFGLYSDLYDLIVKYDFFKDKKYQKNLDDLNLSIEITDVYQTMLMKK